MLWKTESCAYIWRTDKPSFSSKDLIQNNDITIEIDDKAIKDKSELAQTFNYHCINKVKTTTGNHPANLATLATRISKKEIVATITGEFKNHPSIVSIKNKFPPTTELNIKAVTVDHINKLIRSLDATKATGSDKIPVNVVKMSVYVVDKHRTSIINNDFLWNLFSDFAKIASFRLIFEKGERTEMGNYRPVSIFNFFPKMYEKSLHSQMASFSSQVLWDFSFAYRKGYSANHALIRLIENWKTSLDKNLFTGAALMELSKAFYCIPHDLLIAKLHLTEWVSTRAPC